MDHPLSRQISGLCCYSFTYSYLVVDINTPRDGSQRAMYGETVRSWKEDDFSSLLSSLTAALAISSIAIVVWPDYFSLSTSFPRPS